jgi:probable HAF family extracellular repeat protein
MSEVDDIDPVLGVKELRAALWKQGEIVNLGTLGGTLSFANGAINDRGQVVGAATNAIPDPFSFIYLLAGSSNGTQTRAFLWKNGMMQDIGTLGGPDAVAIYVNEHSQVAGDSYTNFTPNPVTGLPSLDPFLWEKEKGRIDIGTLGGAWGYPAGVNNRGQVVGYSSLAADPGACTAGGGFANCDVFLWDRGTLTDLTATTNGGSPSFVFGINDKEEIVGAAGFPNAPLDAYIWRNGVAADLGHLSDCYSLGFGINSHSQVVGGTFDCIDASHSRAFLWENGAMVDLDDLVPPDSPLQLVEAAAINDRGEIAGNGAPPGVARKDFGTLGHAFLLIPCDENHPGVHGCDYSLVDTHAAVPQTSSAVGNASSRTLSSSLLRRMNRFRFPGSAFGPRN